MKSEGTYLSTLCFLIWCDDLYFHFYFIFIFFGLLSKLLLVFSYKPYFIRYSETSKMVSDKKLKIINDGSTSNDTRLGAVADIQFALNSGDKTDDLDVLVIAGDTLFLQDFKLEEFIGYVLSYFK